MNYDTVCAKFMWEKIDWKIQPNEDTRVGMFCGEVLVKGGMRHWEVQGIIDGRCILFETTEKRYDNAGAACRSYRQKEWEAKINDSEVVKEFERMSLL